jgi:metal-responsive CopG/Arc/MetJ family transcriptional regulator
MTATNSDRTERLQIVLPADVLAAIDDFQHRNRIPTRAAAARELLKRGLALADKDCRRSHERTR